MPRQQSGKNSTFSGSISPEHKQLLRVEAAKRGFTLSAYIEQIIKEFTKDYTEFEVNKRGTK